MSAWAVKDATKSWDSVFDRAWAGEPQFVSRGGAQTVVVISLQTYETAKTPKKRTLLESLRSCPFGGIDIGDSAERLSRQSGLAMFEKLHEGGPILEDEDMNVFDRVQDRGREVSFA